jgi:hypothetical protein
VASGGQQRLISFSQGGSFPLATLSRASASRGLVPDGPQEPETPVPPPRRGRALLFGTDQYDDRANWKALSNPITDVTAIKADLEELYGFETKLLENPSKADVVAALADVEWNRCDDNGQLLLVFAGHGDFDEVADEGYLITRDSAGRGISSDRTIGHSILAKMIERIPCKHILVVLDTCFGGTFDQKIASSSARGEPMYEDVDRETFIARKLKYKSRLFLASGGKDYVPDGRPGQHSPFARKFLEALRGLGTTDHVLTFDELKGVVEKVTPEPRGGELPGNEPGGDFLLVVKDEKTRSGPQTAGGSTNAANR